MPFNLRESIYFSTFQNKRKIIIQGDHTLAELYKFARKNREFRQRSSLELLRQTAETEYAALREVLTEGGIMGRKGLFTFGDPAVLLEMDLASAAKLDEAGIITTKAPIMRFAGMIPPADFPYGNNEILCVVTPGAIDRFSHRDSFVGVVNREKPELIAHHNLTNSIAAHVGQNLVVTGLDEVISTDSFSQLLVNDLVVRFGQPINRDYSLKIIKL